MSKDKKEPKDKQPRNLDHPSFHTIAFFVFIGTFVFDAASNPAIPILSKLVGSVFFLSIAVYALKKDYDANVKRNLLFEQFSFEETEKE